MGSPSHQGRGGGGGGSDEEREEEQPESWRLRVGSGFRVPDRFHRQAPFYARIFGGSHGAPRRPPHLSCLLPSTPSVSPRRFLDLPGRGKSQEIIETEPHVSSLSIVRGPYARCSH